MGNQQELKLHEILDISNGINLVDSDSILPFQTSYKLGLLGNYCKPIIEANKKEVNKANTKYNQERGEILKMYVGKEEKDIPQDVLNEINAKYTKLQEDLEATRDMVHKIQIPEFKLSEFQATEDTKQFIPSKGGVEVNIIKKGNSLVPIKFFKLLAPIIKE